MENKAVSIVTIKTLTTIYKDGEPANSIELANVEEHNFDIIVAKGLYNIGDKAIYIQPDYCAPLMSTEENDITLPQLLFKEYTQPFGAASKSKLGKNGRIKAVKFNFTKLGATEVIYSMGILLPTSEVLKIMQVDVLPDELDSFLEITKYEEPETGHSGLNKGSLPSGMYKTDEPNIMNLTRTQYPITLTGSLKYDGSSITIYYKSDEEMGICSRQLEKKLEQNYVSGYKTQTSETIRKHILFNRETNEKTNGWMNEVTNEFFSEVQSDWTELVTEVRDSFVDLGKPILDKLAAYCKENNLQLALRGELHGQGLKGSGNKNNPHANVKQNIKFYTVDDYSAGVTRKKTLTEFYKIIDDLELEYCDIIFKNHTFNSFEEINEKCNEYFKNNMVEGIVIRDENCYFSAKLMNLEYDSKK